MKKLFTLSLLFFSLTFFCQTSPIIEGTYFPVKNTSIKQVWDITIGSMQVPTTGPNQVWDYRQSNGQFNNIVDTFQFKMLDPASTPSAYAQYFPSATHASFLRTPFDNVSDSLYSYFIINSNGLYNLGGFNIQDKYDSTIINTKNEFYAPSLVTYLSSFTDTSRYVAYAKKYSGLSAKIKGRKIKTGTYVGYGTLKIPNGTYNDVALIKEVNSAIDSIFIDYVPIDGNYVYLTTQTSSTIVYQFLRNNTFGSAYLMYLAANPSNTAVDYGWYTLPIDFGSISGTVYTNTLETTPVTNGKAYLYRENSNFTKNDILAKTNLTATGNYKFDSIPYGEYRIAIWPDTASYPNAKITYFGDTTNWIDAISIITTTLTSPGHKIHLQYHAAPGGNSNISGQITSNPNIFKTSTIAAVKPIPSIGIVVKKNPGGSAERVMVTDTAGKFNLGSLDNGNYKLFVDIPGLHHAGTYTFSVTGNNTINGLDFIVGTDSIHPNNTPFVSIKEFKNSASELIMNAYPNPYSSFATIVINLKEATPVLLEVYNMLGQKIQTLDNGPKQIGIHKYTFSAKNLNYNPGIYFVKLKAGNTTNVIKLIEH